MTRYTRKDAERCAIRLAETLGKKIGKCWIKKNGKNVAIIGCWDLDYNPTYGGAVIEEIINVGGGVTHPFGSRRMKADSFCQATRMAQDAVNIDRKKRKK